MAKLQRKGLDRPDETREAGGARFLTFSIGDHDASWAIAPPGWRWSTALKPLVGGEYCEFHHMGFTLSGRLHVVHRDGAEMDLGPEQFFEIPPFHDAWVVGEVPWVSIDWGQNVGFARSEGTGVGRRVSTMLFTDIVESTSTARRLGDVRWRDMLAEHNRIVRSRLERYRGREVTTTGDGFLALFDSAESAVHAGLAIADAIRPLGIDVRCGVHTGEVEHDAENVRGLSVHVASRVLALARPGEVLVSWTTRDLLSGSRLAFESRGEHELKGLAELKGIYAVRSPAP